LAGSASGVNKTLTMSQIMTSETVESPTVRGHFTVIVNHLFRGVVIAYGYRGT
tara:strand:- start:870 stop:1028 length:159 start_codon:yes stop_codon:yes gene_type:complete